MADPPADLSLAALDSDTRTVRQWLTNFHLALFVLDPYTNESAWLLPTCVRIMRTLKEADVRLAWLVTTDDSGARQFLGELTREFLTFVDPDRTVVKALDLERLPALVWLRPDLTVGGVAQGWDPPAWNEVTTELARVLSWSKPLVPAPNDPLPFRGTDASG